MQGKPLWKRRHWLVVALVFGTTVLWWWYWPRVDQRFVGTWIRAVPQTIELGESFYKLQPDGSGSCGSAGAAETSLHWQVRGPHLQLIYGRRSGLDGLIDQIQHLIGRPSRMYTGQRYLVTERTADRMVWRLVSPGKRITAESNEPFELKRAR